MPIKKGQASLGNEETDILDAEGHKRKLEAEETEDDTQGQKFGGKRLAETEDDVEGHKRK